MTLRSSFFNSINGDRRYDARIFAKYFASLIANGVFPDPSTGLQVYEASNMQTRVRAGLGWINGYFLENDSDFYLNHENADGVLKRIDRIVMRLNHINRLIEIVVKKGGFSSIPVPPDLQRDADFYELALADVYIGNGGTEITQANITDLRLNNNLCGIVHGLVNQVDTTTLYNQYEAWFRTWSVQQQEEFETWLESIKDLLDGDVAANLAQAIGDLSQLNTTDKSSLVNAVNEVNRHTHDFEYQTPVINGNTIALTRQSDTNRLFFKLDADLDISNIKISLDNFSTAVPLKNIHGDNVNKLAKSYIEVVNNGDFFTYAPKGGLNVINDLFGGIATLPVKNTLFYTTNNKFTIGFDKDYLYGLNRAIYDSMNYINKYVKVSKVNPDVIVAQSATFLTQSHYSYPSLVLTDKDFLYVNVPTTSTTSVIHKLDKVTLSTVATLNLELINVGLIYGDYIYFYSSKSKLYKVNKNTMSITGNVTLSANLSRYDVSHGFLYFVNTSNYLCKLNLESLVVITNTNQALGTLTEILSDDLYVYVLTNLYSASGKIEKFVASNLDFLIGTPMNGDYSTSCASIAGDKIITCSGSSGNRWRASKVNRSDLAITYTNIYLGELSSSQLLDMNQDGLFAAISANAIPTPICYLYFQ